MVVLISFLLFFLIVRYRTSRDRAHGVVASLPRRRVAVVGNGAREGGQGGGLLEIYRRVRPGRTLGTGGDGPVLGRGVLRLLTVVVMLLLLLVGRVGAPLRPRVGRRVLRPAVRVPVEVELDVVDSLRAVVVGRAAALAAAPALGVHVDVVRGRVLPAVHAVPLLGLDDDVHVRRAREVLVGRRGNVRERPVRAVRLVAGGHPVVQHVLGCAVGRWWPPSCPACPGVRFRCMRQRHRHEQSYQTKNTVFSIIPHLFISIRLMMVVNRNVALQLLNEVYFC